MNQNYLRGIYLRLAGALMLVVILALAASAYLSHRTFERALAPQMSMKVATVGATVRSLVLKAVDNGIKFNELYGVDQKFDDIKEDNPEISYLAITDTNGKVLHQRFKPPQGAEAYVRSAPVLAKLGAAEQQQATVLVGDQYVVTLPIVSSQGPLGLLHIGVGVGFVDSIVMDMLFDVMVVLVVALFVTLELLNFMAGARIEAALRALGDTIERGTQGDFTAPREASPTHEFSAVQNLLEAVLARVNNGYQALTKEVEAGRHGPAHERLPGLYAAQQGLAQLVRKFRFGVDDAPRGASDTELNKVRAPLFVFILAEELTRSFLPSYVNQLQVAIPGLSPALVVGLPIALFMLIVAIGQPFIGAWSERVGHRRAMRIGAVVAAAGFFATAFAHNVLDLLLWRSLCAVGYAMVFVAAQGYVLNHSAAGNRARSFALFIGAIMVATVCGPSIGGILADNAGARPTFVIAALLALASMWAMHSLPGKDPVSEAPSVEHKVPTLKEIGSLMTSLRFMAVTGLAAIPAKIMLTGMLFYLVPMYMLSVGANQAMTGRILMAYAVMMVVMGPMSAAWANSRQRMEWLVGGGLMLSGLGGMVLLAGGGVLWVFAAVVLVGLGQSMSMAAQTALVSERCPEDVARLGEHAVYGVYRLLERLGNAAGPLIAGALVLLCGYRNSFVALGGMAVLCGLLFTLSAQRAQRPALVPA